MLDIDTKEIDRQLNIPLRLKQGEILLCTPISFRAGDINETMVLKPHHIPAVIRFLKKAQKKRLDLNADFDIHRKRTVKYSTQI